MPNQGQAYIVCVKLSEHPISLYMVYCDDVEFSKLGAIEVYIADHNLPPDSGPTPEILGCVLLDTALFHAYRNELSHFDTHPFITVSMLDDFDTQIQIVFARDEDDAKRETLNSLNDSIPLLITDGLVDVPVVMSIYNAFNAIVSLPLMDDAAFEDEDDGGYSDEMFLDEEDDDDDDDD